MLDRYDVRDKQRDRGDAWDRSFGSRGGATERDRDQGCDPRDVFTKDLDLPRGRERQPVRDRERVYEINGAESRMLATVGAFRVVSESDLHDGREESRKAQRHLEQEGLLRTSPLNSDDRAVVLTDRGRDLIEANRHERQERTWEPRQACYAGLREPRELTHDSKVYRAYLRAEERLREQGGRVDRVVLDYELKRDYQRFLHERNRGRKDCDGRPDREPQEIARWAREHDLPYDDGHVHFPDARIEYEDRDGRSHHEDIEIVTGHYRAPTPKLSPARDSAAIAPSAACSAAARAPAGEEGLVTRGWLRSCWDEPSASAGPIDIANAERINAISSFGFTERQAQFLVNVLLHAGVFVERQYCAFAGIVHGQKSTDFIRLLSNRVLFPRSLWKARLVYQHAAREHLGERLDPANVQVLEWLFPERKRLSEPGAGPADERYVKTSKNIGAPRFRALYLQWLEDPTNTLWMAGSTTLADALDRDHGRVECVELSRQYLHLSPLVDVA